MSASQSNDDAPNVVEQLHQLEEQLEVQLGAYWVLRHGYEDEKRLLCEQVERVRHEVQNVPQQSRMPGSRAGDGHQVLGGSNTPPPISNNWTYKLDFEALRILRSSKPVVLDYTLPTHSPGENKVERVLEDVETLESCKQAFILTSKSLRDIRNPPPKTPSIRNLSILCRGQPKHDKISQFDNKSSNKQKCDICGQNFYLPEILVSCNDCKKVMHGVCCNVDLLALSSKKPELKVFKADEDLLKRYSCGYESKNSNGKNRNINTHCWDKCSFSMTKRKCDNCRKKIGFAPKEEKAVQCKSCKLKLDKKCENVFKEFIYPRRELIIKACETLSKTSSDSLFHDECVKLVEEFTSQMQLVTKCCHKVVHKMREQNFEVRDLMQQISKAVPNLNSMHECLLCCDMTKGDSLQNMSDRLHYYGTGGVPKVPPIALGSPSLYSDSLRTVINSSHRLNTTANHFNSSPGGGGGGGVVVTVPLDCGIMDSNSDMIYKAAMDILVPLLWTSDDVSMRIEEIPITRESVVRTPSEGLPINVRPPFHDRPPTYGSSRNAAGLKTYLGSDFNGNYGVQHRGDISSDHNLGYNRSHLESRYQHYGDHSHTIYMREPEMSETTIVPREELVLQSEKKSSVDDLMSRMNTALNDGEAGNRTSGAGGGSTGGSVGVKGSTTTGTLGGSGSAGGLGASGAGGTLGGSAAAGSAAAGSAAAGSAAASGAGGTLGGSGAAETGTLGGSAANPSAAAGLSGGSAGASGTGGTLGASGAGSMGASGAGSMGASGAGSMGASGAGSMGASGAGSMGASGAGSMGASGAGASGVGASGAGASGVGLSGTGSMGASGGGSALRGSGGSAAGGSMGGAAGSAGAGSAGAVGGGSAMEEGEDEEDDDDVDPQPAGMDDDDEEDDDDDMPDDMPDDDEDEDEDDDDLDDDLDDDDDDLGSASSMSAAEQADQFEQTQSKMGRSIKGAGGGGGKGGSRGESQNINFPMISGGKSPYSKYVRNRSTYAGMGPQHVNFSYNGEDWRTQRPRYASCNNSNCCYPQQQQQQQRPRPPACPCSRGSSAQDSKYYYSQDFERGGSAGDFQESGWNSVGQNYRSNDIRGSYAIGPSSCKCSSNPRSVGSPRMQGQCFCRQNQNSPRLVRDSATFIIEEEPIDIDFDSSNQAETFSNEFVMSSDRKPRAQNSNLIGRQDSKTNFSTVGSQYSAREHQMTQTNNNTYMSATTMTSAASNSESINKQFVDKQVEMCYNTCRKVLGEVLQDLVRNRVSGQPKYPSSGLRNVNYKFGATFSNIGSNGEQINDNQNYGSLGSSNYGQSCGRGGRPGFCGGGVGYPSYAAQTFYPPYTQCGGCGGGGGCHGRY
ncbi:uncharacterized protein LOC142341753 isoform X2 [Convolutriloba macropyga]|uniref:uncharacterized protein LOC142341753 isoform X2 n=1 Tax=Convolutriloba macropyga TaxID=536237 RepID=UPI003F52193E